MKKWKGCIAFRRPTDPQTSKPIARSPVYEFDIKSTPTEWGDAMVELLRRWQEQGEPLEGEGSIATDDPALYIYGTLSVGFGGLVFGNEQRLFREGVDSEADYEAAGSKTQQIVESTGSRSDEQAAQPV